MTETTERAELARDIPTWQDLPFGGRNDYVKLDANSAHAIAGVLIEKGWRKPRTVTTAEELDALPEGSIVLDIGGEPWQKDGSVFLGQLGGALTSKRLAHAALPATVLHVG